MSTSVRKAPVVASLVLLACLPALSACGTAPPREAASAGEKLAVRRFAEAVIDDHRAGYSSGGLARLLPHVAVHGALANSNADRWIRDTWQAELRSESGDDFFYKFLRAGDFAQNRISVPAYALTMTLAGYSGIEDEDNAAATWAARSLRANILGGPQGWALTYMLGSHRPYVGGSGWNPWNDNDGVSGHALYGAVPFLTAAKMTDSTGWKATWYVASTLPALARININKHYSSQAYLGWAIAHVSTGVVAEQAEAAAGELSWILLPLPDGAYASLSLRF